MRVHERYREREAYFSFDAFRYGALPLTYASRARPQYGPTQYSEDQKTSNSGIAQPCLNHGWLMQPVPVILGISPGEYILLPRAQGGTFVMSYCIDLLRTWTCQYLRMARPPRGPEAFSRTPHVLKTAVSMKQQFLEHAVF